MTAAVIALSILAAGLGGALVWALRSLDLANRAELAAGKKLVDEMGAWLLERAGLAKERDDARASSARLGAELNAASAELESIRELLQAAREVITEVRSHAVLDAPADQRGALVDELLRQRVAEVAARRAAAAGAGAGDRPAPADAVSGPGPGAGAT